MPSADKDGAQSSVGTSSEAKGKSTGSNQRPTAGTADDDSDDDAGDLDEPASVKVSRKVGGSGLGPAAADAARRAQDEAAALEAELCEGGHAKGLKDAPKDEEAREVDGESKDMN